MQLAGYATIPDGTGDVVQPEAPDGKWLDSMNVAAAFHYMKFGLKLPEGSVEFVHPNLLKLYMEAHVKGCAGDAEEEAQQKRKVLLQNLLKSKAVVLMPVHYGDHYALLVVDGRDEATRTLFWRDSLPPGEAMKAHVDAAMAELTGWEVPEACNAAVQPLGSALCGCYVLHWMEQACRSLVLNEAGCSIGWPKADVWAGRVHKLVEMMTKEQNKLKIEHEAALLKMFSDGAKKKAADAAKTSAVAKDAVLVDLKETGSSLSSKIPAGKPCLENLSKAAQEAVQKAGLGAGICSKCHWQSGCFMCSGAKALQYWLKKEGLVVDTVAYVAPK
jgi:hypothetical protein